MKVELNGKSAIVTGGAKGYGLGITRALRQRGVRVFVTGRDQGALDAVASETGAVAVRADVTSGADWDLVFDCVEEECRTLDILVNNAGAGIRIAHLAELTDAEIAESIAVNLTGAALGCRRAAARMRDQGSGTIINVSSVCQRQAWPGFGPYSAAKAGLGMLSDCLYAELREYGVRVTTLIPSWGATGFGEAAGLPKRDTDLAQKCIQPGEIGDLVVTICELPAHLQIQDLTLWPMVQDVVPL